MPSAQEMELQESREHSVGTGSSARAARAPPVHTAASPLLPGSDGVAGQAPSATRFSHGALRPQSADQKLWNPEPKPDLSSF